MSRTRREVAALDDLGGQPHALIELELSVLLHLPEAIDLDGGLVLTAISMILLLHLLFVVLLCLLQVGRLGIEVIATVLDLCVFLLVLGLTWVESELIALEDRGIENVFHVVEFEVAEVAQGSLKESKSISNRFKGSFVLPIGKVFE